MGVHMENMLAEMSGDINNVGQGMPRSFCR
jgi:hypothetical protein